MRATLPRAVADLAALAAVLAGCSTSHDARPHLAAPSRPTTSSAPAPTASTPAPTGVHEVVAAAAPTRFVFRAKHFTIRAQVCGMAYVRPLDPPGEQHHTVCWVQRDFGFAPGSSARGTTYVLGHSWAEDPQEVLNKISEQAMREVLPQIRHNAPPHVLGGQPTYPIRSLDGSAMTLSTPNGRLTYTVRDAYAVKKSLAGFIAPLMNQGVRNRVVLITCGELDGVDYDYNIIVEAYLTASVAARAQV